MEEAPPLRWEWCVARHPNTFPRGEGAPVRTLGRKRNSGGNVGFGILYQACTAGEYGISLISYRICQVTARIPHQSKFGSEEPNFASFPPGEAMWGAVEDLGLGRCGHRFLWSEEGMGRVTRPLRRDGYFVSVGAGFPSP